MASYDVKGTQNGAVLESQESPAPHRRCGKCCADGPAFWCRKYFWEGQQVHASHTTALEKLEEANHGLRWYEVILLKYRRVIGLILPGLIVHFFWWAFMISYDWWYLFSTRYIMCIVMIVGSAIVGMTSEGGGAVAFPVMTLILSVPPAVARDYSVTIQSFGMSCAAATIFFMKVKLEWHVLVVSSLGGTGGVILGLHLVDPYLTPPQKKLGFTSIWFSFAFALFLLNLTHKRRTFESIPQIKLWKFAVLFVAGFVGGIFTSFAGNGIDICCFCIITLLFRVSEKIATPTSVVVMAINSVVCTYWRAVMMGGLLPLAVEYVAVTIPIVVIGAPMGALIGSHFHRLVLAACIYILDTLALIASYIIVPMTASLIGMSAGLIVGGFIVFFILSKVGQRIADKIALEEKIDNEVLEVEPDNGDISTAEKEAPENIKISTMGKDNPTFQNV